MADNRLRATVIRSQTDFWTGLLLCLVAGAFLVAGRDLASGTMIRIGPGLFPRIVAGLMMVVGVMQVVRGLRLYGPRVGPWGVRGMLAIGAALAVFALGMAQGLGMAVSGAGVILLAALGVGRIRPLETGLLIVIIVGASVLLFHFALGLPIPVWPELA